METLSTAQAQCPSSASGSVDRKCEISVGIRSSSERLAPGTKKTAIMICCAATKCLEYRHAKPLGCDLKSLSSGVQLPSDLRLQSTTRKNWGKLVGAFCMLNDFAGSH